MLTHMQNKTFSSVELWIDFMEDRNPLHMRLREFWPKKMSLTFLQC